MGIKELCNCEGCFKTADSPYRMMGVEFTVCKDHSLELRTSEHKLTIKSRIAEALEYREELLQYNSKP